MEEFPVNLSPTVLSRTEGLLLVWTLAASFLSMLAFLSRLISLSCILQTTCCTLLLGSEAFWLQDLFLLHSSLPTMQVPSQFLSFALCQTQLHGGFLALSEVWDLLPVFSRCSMWITPFVDIFSMFLWEKVSSSSYTSATLSSSVGRNLKPKGDIKK